MTDPRVTDPLRWRACCGSCAYIAYARSNVAVIACLDDHMIAMHLPTSAPAVHTAGHSA